MNLRLRAIVVAVILGLYGCAQSAAPLPFNTAGGPRPDVRKSVVAPLIPGSLNLFNLPSSGGSWPDFIVAGPQRAMWFTEFYGNYIGRVGMDGSITTFTVPGGDAEGISVGPDHNIWFTEPGDQSIVRMTPKGASTTFTLPRSDNESPRGITRGPDGNLWFTELYDGFIGRITPNGTITRFAIGDYSSGPWAITAGPDGDLWFTESGSDKIGRFNPQTETFDSSINVPTKYATPWGILLAPDKRIWFTERSGDKIAEVTASGRVKEFAIKQPGSYPEALAAAAGKLWFTQSQAGTLGSIDPRTGKFGAIIALPPNSIPNGIAVGPNKNLWFCIDAYYQTNQIGELVVR